MVAVVKPRMHVDLLEEIAVGKASKPSTEMGAKMERAKELMDRGNAFMTGNQCDKAIDLFQEVISPSFDEMRLRATKAENLFKSCNDHSRAVEASTKRQQASFQAQMQNRSKEQNTQKARLSVNQAMKCIKVFIPRFN